MLQLIAGLIRAIAIAAPVLGIGDVTKYANVAAMLIETGDAAKADMAELTAQIETMVKEKRNPTEAEWNGLKARSDALHDAIQAAAEET